MLTDSKLARFNATLERFGRKPLSAIEEVAGLPFTVKDDFREAYPLGHFKVPLRDVVRFHMSSGTTGKPVIAGYTRADLALWADTMAWTLRAAQADPSDVVQIAYGYGLFTGGLGFHMGAEQIGCSVIPTSSGVTARQLMLMADLGSTILACTPSYALVLAEAIAREGIRARLRLRAGFFGAESWTREMRAHIERGLGLEAFDIYGLTELGGPGVAVECREHAGLHINEDQFFAEIVDPESGDVLPAGRRGELVLTSLRREATPVLRYRTRDRTALLAEPCPCGSPFVRMESLQGRTDDMLIVRGENVFPTQIEALLLQVPGLTGNYQIVVDRARGALDSIEVVCECAETAGAPATLAAAAAERIRDAIGLRVEMRVVEFGTLARSEGKAQRVVDRR